MRDDDPPPPPPAADPFSDYDDPGVLPVGAVKRLSLNDLPLAAPAVVGTATDPRKRTSPVRQLTEEHKQTSDWLRDIASLAPTHPPVRCW